MNLRIDDLKLARRLVVVLCTTAICCVCDGQVANSAEMETVKLSSDARGFSLHPSGKRFVPWGHNYASVDILERLANDPARVEREFAEMRAAGTTVVRIHPEMPRLLVGPEKADPVALDQIFITTNSCGWPNSKLAKCEITIRR